MRRRNLAFPIGAVIVLLAVAIVGVLLWQLNRYREVRDRLPLGMTIAGVDVSGLTASDASEKVLQTFLSPIQLRYGDRSIILAPYDLGFEIDPESMVAEAVANRPDSNFWLGFRDYLLHRKVDSGTTTLKAHYSQARLLAALLQIAKRNDHPPTTATVDPGQLKLILGQPGTRLDMQKSLPKVDAALRSATDRRVDLVIDEQSLAPSSLDTLRDLITALPSWKTLDGVAGFTIINLSNGQETSFHGDQPFSAMNTMKLPILVAAFRKLQVPSEDLASLPDPHMAWLITQTITETGHDSANALLDYIGDGDQARGARQVTDLLGTLGLKDSFIASPYGAKESPPNIATPANSGPDRLTTPDPFMQTTPQDQAWLMQMIYDCAKSSGTLLAAYSKDFTPAKCQALLDALSQKYGTGSLIESGLPKGTRLAHKHGWVADTHADVGIVFSPKGDYVLSIYFWRKDWLDWNISSARIEELSRITYTFFNP